MAKVKKSFFCKNCGYEAAKWLGKCPSCNEWNTFVEEIVDKKSGTKKSDSSWTSSKEIIKPQPLDAVVSGQDIRILLDDSELNRVLGGGVVTGSLILVGGQPGIGKSTLLLQMAMKAQRKVLYISGEESAQQIKMRADRLGHKNAECYIYTETDIIKMLKSAKELVPDMIIVDSIQTISSPYLDSTTGSVSQIKECAGELQKFAKETGISVFVIGHITKDGSIAGPKLLEHIVDVVLQFEGDQNYSYRILRTLKNRFGSTDEIGIYAMEAGGMREVDNPSELLISQHKEKLSGSSIAASIEGLRPIMIETQALVTTSVYGTPQRSATGFDLRRLSMLLAVLEKRCGLAYGMTDVFLNIAGGIKVSDPAIDLSIVAALISSLHDIPVEKSICFAGEIGLSGEVRAVSRIDQRIQEAARLGFETIYISKYNKGISSQDYSIEVRTISRIDDLLSELFS